MCTYSIYVSVGVLKIVGRDFYVAGFCFQSFQIWRITDVYKLYGSLWGIFIFSGRF